MSEQDTKTQPQASSHNNPPSSSDPIELPQRIGSYELGKTIGKGTFGRVKEGKHLPTGEKVAIKIIDKKSIEDEQDEIRIKREVEIMKMARHPNIIHLYEIIVTADHFFIVTEFAEQGELFRVMNSEVRIKQRAAGRIFYQVLNAVEYLHRLNIAHRDLKPQNILLDPDYNIKLIDFGLSNYCNMSKKLSTACGSPCYAPPEMLAGRPYNGLVGDIWSLGIIFYGMICGSLPFEEKTTKELYKKVMEGFYVLPSDISMEAIQVIQRMLITDPSKRITIPQIRRLKFFKEIKTIEPEIVGLIVGFHAMPIDNEIIQRMKEYRAFKHKQVEDHLKDNDHNQLTTLYYLLQKRTLRDGGKTVSDLQAYLESTPKYKLEYGMESLKKYRKIVLQSQLSIKPNRRILSRQKPKLQDRTTERNAFSNQKTHKRTYTEEKKTSLSKRTPHILRTERSVEEHQKTMPFRKSTHKNSRESPGKSLQVTRKKTAEALWKAYFKNPLENTGGAETVRHTSKGPPKIQLNDNIKRLKEGFLRLPNMARKMRSKPY